MSRAAALTLTVLAAAAAAAACGGSSHPLGSVAQDPGPVPPPPDGGGPVLNLDGGIAILHPDGGVPASDGGVPATCATTIAASDAPAADVVLHLAAGARVGSTLGFTVPAGTASLTIVEQAVSAPAAITFQGFAIENTAVPLLVTGPGGPTDVWFDDRQQPASSPEAALAFFASSAPATGTLTIPNTTAALNRGVLPQGSWSLVVGDLAYECTVLSTNPCGTTGNTASTYDVTVIMKPAVSGAIPASGALDVTFHVVGTQTASTAAPLPTSAAAAAADADVQRMVSTLKVIYAGAGVTVREHFTDVPADVRARYSGLVDVDSAGACAPLAQLLATSGDGTSLHIFLVNGFTAAGLPPGTQIAGVDGTIPGPATLGGTVASGAAVATDALRFGAAAGRCSGAPDYARCGDDLTAMVVAHEMGHFLGLYHVTELTGLDFDPLSDTPACPCTTCRLASATDGACNRNGTGHAMTTGECTVSTACGGGDNLMFWFAPGALGPLTAEQQRVVRANPQIR
ncbi:MAG TPA: hypothetical protein VFP65_05585 [Anaeromyxobacteraceae bacterium]|nr:hypothetical protein [Anaeromyxobacteraceae bacterium]